MGVSLSQTLLMSARIEPKMNLTDEFGIFKVDDPDKPKTISGLIDCLAVTIRHEVPVVGKRPVVHGLVGGHFVTPVMFDETNSKLTILGNEFVTELVKVSLEMMKSDSQVGSTIVVRMQYAEMLDKKPHKSSMLAADHIKKKICHEMGVTEGTIRCDVMSSQSTVVCRITQSVRDTSVGHLLTA